MVLVVFKIMLARGSVAKYVQGLLSIVYLCFVFFWMVV